MQIRAAVIPAIAVPPCRVRQKLRRMEMPVDVEDIGVSYRLYRPMREQQMRVQQNRVAADLDRREHPVNTVVIVMIAQDDRNTALQILQYSWVPDIAQQEHPVVVLHDFVPVFRECTAHAGQIMERALAVRDDILVIVVQVRREVIHQPFRRGYSRFYKRRSFPC